MASINFKMGFLCYITRKQISTYTPKEVFSSVMLKNNLKNTVYTITTIVYTSAFTYIDIDEIFRGAQKIKKISSNGRGSEFQKFSAAI